WAVDGADEIQRPEFLSAQSAGDLNAHQCRRVRATWKNISGETERIQRANNISYSQKGNECD
ncbi:MAG: hypothetical protein JWQ71_4476, partial [Pedosphaera sp.]|nr:hypothetical protein [Pedosphaera sp.]